MLSNYDIIEKMSEDEKVNYIRVLEHHQIASKDVLFSQDHLIDALHEATEAYKNLLTDRMFEKNVGAALEKMSMELYDKYGPKPADCKCEDAPFQAE